MLKGSHTVAAQRILLITHRRAIRLPSVVSPSVSESPERHRDVIVTTKSTCTDPYCQGEDDLNGHLWKGHSNGLTVIVHQTIRAEIVQPDTVAFAHIHNTESPTNRFTPSSDIASNS
jgi:hypothetical protein